MFKGLLPGFNLLQFRIDPNLFQGDDPTNAIVLISVIGAIILITIIVGIIHGATKKSSGMGGSGGPRFYSFSYRRAIASYGLNKEQSKLLTNVFKTNAVRDPERVLQNQSSLDRIFQNAYRSIERNSRTDDMAQRLLTQLFSLRNAVDGPPASDRAQDNRIASNTPAILVIGKENFPVKILSSDSNTFITDIPKNSLGTPLRLTRGTNVSLSFFTQSSKGFSYIGRVSEPVAGGRSGLRIVHGGQVKTLVKRNFRRKQVNMECEFYNVNLEVTSHGRKRTSRLVTGNKKMTGTVLDISAGGCSMKTSTPPTVGSRVKMSIEHDKFYINVLGLVLRTNRSAGYGTILHIKFIKVPRKAFNSIGALVFGY